LTRRPRPIVLQRRPETSIIQTTPPTPERRSALRLPVTFDHHFPRRQARPQPVSSSYHIPSSLLPTP
jgi:hypothetical protein